MPFVKGQSGNPKGRKPGSGPRQQRPLAQLFREAAEATHPSGGTYQERIARIVVEQAAKGILPAVHLYLERTEGKVPDVSKANDRLRVEIVYGQDAPEGGSDDGDE